MNKSTFSVLYFLLLGLFLVLAIPFLLLFTCKKKYRQSIPKRFFLYKNQPLKDDCIWFHGCSFGEIKSFAPLIENLGLHVSLTTTTQTGFSEALKLSDEARYLPFEIYLPFWIKKPKLLVVSEAELWYMFFFVAKAKGAKTVLINARISDKSVKAYQRFAWFYKKIFENVDIVFAQSQKDKERLESLGAKNVQINGNIKTASIPKITKSFKKLQKRVITIASSHEGEEELILENVKFSKSDMLIIAPRHPERFLHVRNLAQEYARQNHLTCKFFSEDGFCECDVLVCDCLGELINIYAISDVSFLCGSFIDGIGGHNPLECAFFNNIIISGKYIFNQKSLYPLVDNIYFCEPKELENILHVATKKSSLHVKGNLEPIIKEIRK